MTAAFLASFVEVVEAFTIVLAVAITTGLKPALMGAGLGMLVLVAIVIVFAPFLSLVPIHLLQFAIGVLLLLFGMRWLRKAILRASGYLPMHDEDRAFREETKVLFQQAADRRAGRLAALATFKAVLLEGIEVVFIVVAVGSAHGLTLYASLGASAACLLVILIGIAIHRPLSRVPENTLKFAVGLMLASFGVFWVGESMGADWPGADLSLLAIFGFLATSSLITSRHLRKARAATVTERIR
jgi:uncharacterized membrane protein